MKTWLMAGVAVMALSGCGGSSDAVGENSSGSIKTTAVGEVVGNIATPTPTPTVAAADAASNVADTAANSADAVPDAPAAADDTVTTH